MFCTDDVITLLERMGDEWLRGECQGRQGIFPITYVTIVQDLPPKALDTGMANIGICRCDTRSVRIAIYQKPITKKFAVFFLTYI